MEFGKLKIFSSFAVRLVTAVPGLMGLMAVLLVTMVTTGIAVTSSVVRAENAPAHKGFLENLHRHELLTSTIPDNGDQNPYAVFVAPVSKGPIQEGDVLVDNFNNSNNLQGTGTTIVDFNPKTKKLTTIAQIPAKLDKCPGGVGLSTAMVMLKSGWIVVGSTPSSDGTTATKGSGCLIVLDSNGKVSSVISGPNINDPWGNMAVLDEGSKASLFVSNSGFGVGAPDPNWTVISKATILRIDISIPEGKAPVVDKQTVIGDGLAERAARDVFLIGPTGLCLSKDGKTLYASDALNNRVIAIADPATRTTSAGLGTEVSKDGMLRRPLAMIMAANGNLLVTNGRNGQVVEIDPVAHKQISARWLDADKAQTPPGSGDLFGLALTPSGDGFYFVDDDNNVLLLVR